MKRAIVLMQAIQARHFDDDRTSFDESPTVVLLDFRKTYDALCREFLFAALHRFGYDPAFVQLIRRMHERTTVRFLVNGELSSAREIRSGIRQGCTLAPLLFIVAAEMLALAVSQDDVISGIETGAGATGKHKVSSSVDDTAVFLGSATELKRLLDLLDEFGAISGLRVQPRKNVIISLNTAHTQVSALGVPVLQSGQTTRYLGIQVSTTSATQANWNDRIRKIKARIGIATTVTTSIVSRVAILNAVTLPAIRFTARYSTPTEEIVKVLERLQKRFLWHGITSTEAARHKVNPVLVFQPRSQGGLGLRSIPLTLKAQALKTSMEWVLAQDGAFAESWHVLAHHERSFQPGCCRQTPIVRRRRRSPTEKAKGLTPQQWGLELLRYQLTAARPPDKS